MDENLQLELSASSGILIETGRYTPLYSLNKDLRQAIPGTAKLMTLLLAVENIKSSTRITISSDALRRSAGEKTPDGIVPQTGDKYPLEYILLRLLFFDSDLAAVALAEHIANSETAFVELMNRRAQALGMSQTRFTTSAGGSAGTGDNLVRHPIYDGSTSGSGAGSEDEYSTPQDLVILLTELTKNETTSSLLSKQDDYLILNGRILAPVHEHLSSLVSRSEGRVVGAFHSSRNGTAMAASFGSINGIQYASVLVSNSASGQVNDTLTLLNACSDYYTSTPLVVAGDAYTGSEEITDTGDRFGLVYLRTVTYIHPVDDPFLKPSVRYLSEGPHRRPIEIGTVAGYVIFELLDGNQIKVPVGPDRSILFESTYLSTILARLQANPDLASLIIFLLAVLCLVLTINVIRNLHRLYRLSRILHYERKSR